jgi:Na+/proline symporter
MDFIKPLARRRDENFFLSFSKTSTVAWAALLVLTAYLSRRVEFVLNAAFSLRGLTSGALVGGLILALLWRNTRPAPVITGMLASLGVMTAIEVLPTLPATKGFWMAHVGTQIFWPWYTLIGAVVTLSVAWIVRALSQSERSL